MQTTIEEEIKNPFDSAIEPFKEIAAYEAIWTDYNMSFAKLSEKFKKNPSLKPSDFVSKETIQAFKTRLLDANFLGKTPIETKVLFYNTLDYPEGLLDAREQLRLLYYKGDLNLLKTRSVAIVGSRGASPEGIKRTKQLVRDLVKDGFTIVSGLAKGIDRAAHEAAIEMGGKTIAVIGTPINQYYPKDHKSLQDEISKNHLLLSQVPFIRYNEQDFRGNRLFFPERNKTMSALTEGTVIVEASDTSGTLTQAKAALFQKRKLFILKSCFDNTKISWPAKFEKEGAVKVEKYSDIINSLGKNEKDSIY